MTITYLTLGNEEILISIRDERLDISDSGVISHISREESENGWDVMMKDLRQNICYGMEIETESDYSMPERVATYDVCEYECQIKEIISTIMSFP